MKVVTKFLVVLSAICFSIIAMGEGGLSIYASSSGVAAIKNINGNVSILILAGGRELGEATSGSCVVAANLSAIKGGFDGRLIPVITEINSYDEAQAQGKKIIIEVAQDSIVVSDVDSLGICALDSGLVNAYKKINVGDKQYKQLYAEMIDLAHTDALALFRKGRTAEAIERLSSFASDYNVSWLADKNLAGVVISAINDYAYFLQENNEALASIAFLDNVVAAEPHRAAAWLNLADSNWMIGKKDVAVKQYSEYKNIMSRNNVKSKIPSRVIERINTHSGS